MKTNASLITVRSDSSRLPNKAFLKIRGRLVIEHIIDRAKCSKETDKIILCTTERSIDDELEKIAQKNNILCFRGSLEDKLDRWRGAVLAHHVDTFVTVDGDDVFCDPELTDLAFKQMKRRPCDFIQAPKDLVCGSFTYCLSSVALQKVCQIKDSTNTEMMWVYFTDTGLFSCRDLDVKDPIFHNHHVRATLDYPEDFAFFAAMFEVMDMQDNTVPLRKILKKIAKKPQLADMNFFRQAQFLANQKSKTFLSLKK